MIQRKYQETSEIINTIIFLTQKVVYDSFKKRDLYNILKMSLKNYLIQGNTLITQRENCNLLKTDGIVHLFIIKNNKIVIFFQNKPLHCKTLLKYYQMRMPTVLYCICLLCRIAIVCFYPVFLHAKNSQNPKNVFSYFFLCVQLNTNAYVKHFFNLEQRNL